jgi:hypothetical protein
MPIKTANSAQTIRPMASPPALHLTALTSPWRFGGCSTMCAQLRQCAGVSRMMLLFGVTSLVKPERPMQQQNACPKCRATMQPGYVVDYTYGGVLVSSWIEGIPEKGWFGGLRVWRKRKVPITTYRCPACGYLESYAS